MNFLKSVSKKSMMFLFLLSALFFTGCEKLDYYRAVHKNTIPAFEHFIRTHNHSLLLRDAHNHIERLRFEQAKALNTIPAFSAFQRAYTWGGYRDSASVYIEKLAFENAKQANTLPALQNFLQSSFANAYIDSANILAEQIAASRRPEFRNARTAAVVVNQSYGDKGSLNEFIDLPLEAIVRKLLAESGIALVPADGGGDLTLRVNVVGNIVKIPDHLASDSLSTYGVALNMHFSANSWGTAPVSFEAQAHYFPPWSLNLDSIAGAEYFEKAFWQIDSFPTQISAFITQCLGANGAVSLIGKDQELREHLVEALTLVGVPAADVLFGALQEVNEKNLNIAAVLSRIGDRRVTPFLIRALASETAAHQSTAMRLLQMAPVSNAVPLLAKIIEQRRTIEPCLTAIATLGFLQNDLAAEHLIQLLEDRDERIRLAAVSALEQSKHSDAVEPLIRCFNDDEREVANRAMKALQSFGAAAVEPLKAALEHEKPNTVWRAMTILGELRDETAVEKIIPLLGHTNHYTSWQARQVLGRFDHPMILDAMVEALDEPKKIPGAAAVLGELSAEAVQPLIRAFKPENEMYANIEIIRALGKLGDRRASVFLTDIVNADQIVLQAEAIKALGMIKDKDALPLFTKLYQSNDDLMLRAAILEAWGCYDKPKRLKEIRQGLTDVSNELRLRAVQILDVRGDETALPDFIKAINDPERRVNSAAESALLQRGDAAVIALTRQLRQPISREEKVRIVSLLGKSRSALAAAPLIKELDDPDTHYVSTIKFTLQSLGEPAIIQLLETLRTGRPLQRRRAAEILAAINEPRAVPEFIKYLTGADADLKRIAVAPLGELRYAPAVALLMECLRATDVKLAVAAAAALGKIGDLQSVPVLIRTLDSPQIALAVESAAALGKIRDARAVPALVALLNDREPSIRTAAGDALAQIGEPAVEPLCALMNEQNPKIVATAADLLARIGRPAVQCLLTYIKTPSTSGWYAVEALGKIKDERAVQPLIDSLLLDDEYFYQRVRSALAAIGQPAWEPTAQLLRSENPNLRWKAVELIYAFREPTMMHHFITALNDKEWRVRFAASKSLESISVQRYGMNARKWRKWYQSYQKRRTT